MKHVLSLIVFVMLAVGVPGYAKSELADAIEEDYKKYLEPLFKHFHANPELSTVENETAARMAQELEAAGFEVTTGVGGTGVVAILKNGDGPLVSMRADMDGLPVEEKSGLEYASKAKQIDPITGNEVSVMHACGHDVHITSLVGTARRMQAIKDQWSGTLMLIVQPAEERVLGAKAMMEDGLYERFGTPDYALAYHVNADIEAGKLRVIDGSPYAGVDTVDILIHGVGAHGASPHEGKDPIVLGAQIVMALQTLVSRELAPRMPGLITVGSFHAGSKHNIIPDHAVLQLTVRNTNPETRELLLNGIKRIAENLGRAAGLPEDKLPEIMVLEENVAPTMNSPELAQQLRGHWIDQLGNDVISKRPILWMGGEDFPHLTTDPYIPSVYYEIGGTPPEEFVSAAQGESSIASHHSPQFKIAAEPAVTLGVQTTVLALLELMPASN